MPQYNRHQRHTRLNGGPASRPTPNGCIQKQCTTVRSQENTKKMTRTSQHVSRCMASYTTSNHVYTAWLVQSYRPLISKSPFTCFCTMHTHITCNIPLTPSSAVYDVLKPPSKWHLYTRSVVDDMFVNIQLTRGNQVTKLHPIHKHTQLASSSVSWRSLQRNSH